MATAAGAGIDMVAFGCGPYRCLLRARQVLGMANAAVEAVPIERWLALPDPPTLADRCFLALTTPDGPLTVAVPKPVALEQVPLDTLRPLPPLTASACRLPALRALQFDGRAWGLVLSLSQ